MDEVFLLNLYINALVLVIGACVGSFLNVVIYRLPAGESVVTPRSHCRCGKPIAWYDNIPVLSWFILRGRCRHCGERFSIRYPLIEAGTALLFLGLWHAGGWPVGLVWIVFAGMMIPAAFIDLDTMRLPNPLVGLLALIGAAGSTLSQLAKVPAVPLIGFEGRLGDPLVASATGALVSAGFAPPKTVWPRS